MVANNPLDLVPRIMTCGRYVLDENGDPQPMPNLLTWAEWYEHRKERTDDWIVAKTKVGDVEVSTVFLALDHNHTGVGPPILFETMCFAGKRGEEFGDEEFFDRYATREEAKAGHERIVERVRQATAKPEQPPNTP